MSLRRRGPFGGFTDSRGIAVSKWQGPVLLDQAATIDRSTMHPHGGWLSGSTRANNPTNVSNLMDDDGPERAKVWRCAVALNDARCGASNRVDSRAGLRLRPN